jgi:hypothetical protein
MTKAFDQTKVDVIESHPWPLNSILKCFSFQSDKWGILFIFKDSTKECGINFYFDETQAPTEEEVNKRWKDRFEFNKKKQGNQSQPSDRQQTE